MKKVHTLRAKAGVTAGLVLVAGLGVAATASPAAAAGYCNTGKSIMKGSSNHIYVPANGTSTNCTMAQGANGNHVKALQRALKDCYDVGLEAERTSTGSSARRPIRPCGPRRARPAPSRTGSTVPTPATR